MRDASRPQRIEVLKSNVGEMKLEFSHTRAHIEQMIGMMKQPLHTRSAEGGQQKEESGGTGRGDANDDSGDAGRTSREEGASGAKVGATKAAVLQEKESPAAVLQEKESSCTAEEPRMDQHQLMTWAGDQRFRLAWARWSTCSAAELETHFSQV